MVRSTLSMNLSHIKRLYKGNGLQTLYTYIRFWENQRLERINNILPKEGKIIDLGCGIGVFANYIAASFPKRKVLGIEFDKEKVEIAKKAAKKGGIKNITFESNDITELSFAKADAIILMHVLHHLRSYADQEKLIKKCVNKLNPHGILIINEPDKTPFSLQYLFALVTDNLLYWGDRFTFRTKKDILNLLKSFDLEVETKNVSLITMPYPELVYICRKTQ